MTFVNVFVEAFFDSIIKLNNTGNLQIASYTELVILKDVIINLQRNCYSADISINQIKKKEEILLSVVDRLITLKRQYISQEQEEQCIKLRAMCPYCKLPSIYIFQFKIICLFLILILFKLFFI